MFTLYLKLFNKNIEPYMCVCRPGRSRSHVVGINRGSKNVEALGPRHLGMGVADQVH